MSLSVVCPGKLCHGTSVKSIYRKTGEAQDQTQDPGLEGEQIDHYATAAKHAYWYNKVANYWQVSTCLPDF